VTVVRIGGEHVGDRRDLDQPDVPAAEHRDGRDAERLEHPGHRLERRRGIGREVQGEHPGVTPPSDQPAGARREPERVTRLAELVEEHVRRRQGGVPAQVHLDRGGHPTKRPASVDRVQEGGLGDVVLGGEGLHAGGVERPLGDHDRGRVPGERTIGERIDDVLGDRHPPTLPDPDQPGRGHSGAPAGDLGPW
jgi:hypothetical protein